MQCSRVPHRVLFLANPQLRIHKSTLGETLLGVGCSVLRLADPVLLEDHHVSPALELRAEKHGVKRDLVAGNPDDAQLVEERLAVRAELLHEGVVGRPVVEDATRVAGDVRADEVDVVLGERVERDAVREDPAFLAVFALDVRLLRGAVGVAVEQVDAPRRDLRRVVFGIGPEVLDHLRVAELRAVVREDDEEELLEQIRACELPQFVEEARAGRRILLLAEECDHDVSRQEHCEEDLPSDLADDGVEFGPFRHVVGAAELDEGLVVASDAALGLALGLLPLPALPAPAGLGKVSALRVEEPARDVVVHGALGDALELVGIVHNHVPHGLPLEDAGRKHLVHRLDVSVRGVDARARVVQQALAVGLRSLGDVDALHERAGLELLAPVADVRLHREVVAGRLPVFGAVLEAPRRVFPQDEFLVPVEEPQGAGVVVRADAVGASESLGAEDGAVDDLVEDRGLVASEVVRDLRRSPSGLEQEVDALPAVDCHLSHFSIPCCLVPTIRTDTRPSRTVKVGQNTETRRVRESKRTFLPRGRYNYEKNLTLPTTPWKSHPYCRTNHTKSGAFTSAIHLLKFILAQTRSIISNNNLPANHLRNSDLNFSRPSIPGICDQFRQRDLWICSQGLIFTLQEVLFKKCLLKLIAAGSLGHSHSLLLFVLHPKACPYLAIVQQTHTRPSLLFCFLIRVPP